MKTGPHRFMKRAPATKQILCHRCGESHPVSLIAVNTVCPACGALISLENTTIHGQESRLIDTRGDLVIPHGAYLYTPFAICRNAYISGKISGMLWCEGICRVEGSGMNSVQIQANEFHVPKRADFRCPFPVQAKSFFVRGRLEADLYCKGMLHVARGGVVVGNIFARSVQADKGSQLIGLLYVGLFDLPKIDLLSRIESIPTLPVAIPSPRRKKVVTFDPAEWEGD
jgi:cytoskeletal protein CcmA (bactofilin family)/ribosomal protein L37E